MTSIHISDSSLPEDLFSEIYYYWERQDDDTRAYPSFMFVNGLPEFITRITGVGNTNDERDTWIQEISAKLHSLKLEYMRIKKEIKSLESQYRTNSVGNITTSMIMNNCISCNNKLISSNKLKSFAKYEDFYCSNCVQSKTKKNTYALYYAKLRTMLSVCETEFNCIIRFLETPGKINYANNKLPEPKNGMKNYWL